MQFIFLAILINVDLMKCKLSFCITTEQWKSIFNCQSSFSPSILYNDDHKLNFGYRIDTLTQFHLRWRQRREKMATDAILRPLSIDQKCFAAIRIVSAQCHKSPSCLCINSLVRCLSILNEDRLPIWVNNFHARRPFWLFGMQEKERERDREKSKWERKRVFM